MRQTFDAGAVQRIQITNLNGELRIHGWDQPTIEVTSSDEIDQLQPRDNILFIDDCDEDLIIRLPYTSTISASDIKESVEIEHVQQVELYNVHDDLQLKTIQGDVTIDQINGDTNLIDIYGVVTLNNLNGDLSADNLTVLQGGNALHGDVAISTVQAVRLAFVGGDLSIRSAGLLTVEHIGNDCHVANSEQAAITIGSVGEDLIISGASQVTVEHIGSDANIRAVQDSVRLETVGNDLILTDIGGEIRFVTVGGDAVLKNVRGQVNAGSIGGDIHLQADFAPESVSHLKIGGDASIILPSEPNLTIQAFVGGDISGRAIVSSQLGNRATLTYGEGAARLELMAGGDLVLRSDKGPKHSSNSNVWWDDFGREMADFGREMSNLGRDLGTELSSAFSDIASSVHLNTDYHATENIHHQKAREEAEKQRQKAEEQRHNAEEKAQRAAAIEAEAARQSAPANIEQEREAILRMIAEGRISPEEGDMLLEALDS